MGEPEPTERKRPRFRTPRAGQSLAEVRPDLVAEWHPTLNGDLTPATVSAGTNHKVWWKCPKGPDHEWEASGGERVRGRGCPYCAGKRASVTNSVASIPHLASEWHPTLNGDLTPADVVVSTHKRLWWKCLEGPDHEWQAAGHTRFHGNGCPFCAGQRASVTNSVASIPRLELEWHPTLNGDLRPEDVVAGVRRKLWWQCPQGHEWDAAGYTRVTGTGCPYCANQRVTQSNSLANHPDLAAQWHPTLNGDLTPDQVVAGSNKRHWWRCPDGPDHEWQAATFSRVSGVGCPFCAGQRASVTNSIASNPVMASQWHPTLNGEQRPEYIPAGVHRKFWWKCDKGADHEWQAIASSRRSGVGCPFCDGKQVSVGNSLATVLPDLAAQWHPTLNGTLGPEQVAAGSNRKVWWKCPEGSDHEWQATIKNRRHGRGCPLCMVPGGYKLDRPGALYVLCGEQWGKVGISNVLAQRLAQHASGGAFGPIVTSIGFTDGRLPPVVERALCDFIADQTDERADSSVGGYTESFPARLLDLVQVELSRLLDALPESGWTVHSEHDRLTPYAKQRGTSQNNTPPL